MANNLLFQNFAAVAPNQVRLTNITYIPPMKGAFAWWPTIRISLHRRNRRLRHEQQNDQEPRASLFQAVTVKRPAAGLIHHSDCDSQYCSRKCRNFLQQFKMQSSMSRRGDCYDNAPMEGFWAP